MSTKKQMVNDRRVTIDLDDLFDGNSPMQVISAIHELQGKHLSAKTAKLVFKVSPYGYDGAIDVTLEHYRWETDDEFNRRLAAVKKQQDDKEKKRLAKLEKARQALYQQEQDERQEYERLKKKFGE